MSFLQGASSISVGEGTIILLLIFVLLGIKRLNKGLTK